MRSGLYSDPPGSPKRARRIMNRAIIRGDLIRPDICEHCGRNPRSEGKRGLEGHHHNGYSDESALDVVWLCARCHKLAHPNSPEGVARIVEANTGRRHSEESKRKMSSSRAGVSHWTPERRKAQSERQKEFMSDPARREVARQLAVKNRPWEARKREIL